MRTGAGEGEGIIKMFCWQSGLMKRRLEMNSTESMGHKTCGISMNNTLADKYGNK